jgi:TPR repeat protein
MLNGEGGPADPVQAVHWLNLAAQHNYPQAISRLAVIYESGIGVSKDLVRASELWEKAAAAGDVDARTHLSANLWNRANLTSNMEDRVLLLERAAEYGHVEAQAALGTIYYSGLGVGEDRFRAAMYWRMAADAGHRESENNLRSLEVNERVRQEQEVIVPHIPRIS